jgi:hypothetical protein
MNSTRDFAGEANDPEEIVRLDSPATNYFNYCTDFLKSAKRAARAFLVSTTPFFCIWI